MERVEAPFSAIHQGRKVPPKGTECAPVGRQILPGGIRLRFPDCPHHRSYLRILRTISADPALVLRAAKVLRLAVTEHVPTKAGRSRRKRRDVRPVEPAVASQPPAAAPAAASSPAASPLLVAIFGVVALGVGVWSYFPAISQFVTAWNTEPDYSHGYLVVPLAVVLLTLRRKSFSGWGQPSLWFGGALLAFAVVLRLTSAWYFLETLDAWSLVVWVAAVTALFCGRKVLWWSLPAIGFLLFMIPLPFGAEQALSLQLQTVATKLSCWSLQLLGQPALAEGHTILLGDHRLEVAQACSGLRLFVSILAVAYFYLVAVPRPWWERTVLVAAALPIAVATNAMRIVVTGMLFQFASSEAAHKFAHDMAGFVMIPVAAVLFGLLLWYLTMLFPWEEELDVSAVVNQARA